MRTGAEGPFYRETEELEGNIEHMYCDSLGFVTVGFGHKIESDGELDKTGARLPFRFYGSNFWASEAEILQEFERIKQKGGDYKAARTVARLYLSGLDRAEDFSLVLGVMEEALPKWLPDWDAMPGEAQIAVMSMAWNLGTNFLNPSVPAYWPNLHKQLKAHDYFGAAGNCLINGRESARNRYNRVHFLNAQRLVNLKLNLGELPGNKLLVSASRVVAAAKSPSKADQDAWNIQAALQPQGFYTSVLDGKFGTMSQTAWKNYCREEGIGYTYSMSTIARLFGDAKFDATVTT